MQMKPSAQRRAWSSATWKDSGAMQEVNKSKLCKSCSDSIFSSGPVDRLHSALESIKDGASQDFAVVSLKMTDYSYR